MDSFRNGVSPCTPVEDLMADTTTPKRRRIVPFAYALICAAVVLAVSVFERLDMFQGTEHTTQDLRFRIRGIEQPSDKIAIVAIDPQTLDLLGLIGVPPRSNHVKLIDNLYKAGAKAVLLDILFLTYTGEKNPADLTVTPSAQDSLLSDVIFSYPSTVIARKQVVPMEKSTSSSAGEPPLPMTLFQYPDQLAFVDMYHDADSFVRRSKLIADDLPPETGWTYSFALRAAMFSMDADTAWVDRKEHCIHVGNRIVPLDENDTMIVNYCMDEKTYSDNQGYISYEQVLDDESEYGLAALIKAGRLKDKVVIVGATFPESKDWEFTPFYLGTKVYSKAEYPMFGVDVHKNIASTIIDGRFIYPVREWQTVFLIALMAMIATFVSYRFKGFGGMFGSVGLIAVYAAAAVVLFDARRILIPLVAPSFATVTLTYIGAVTYNFLSERKQKAMIRGVFSHYVPGKVVSVLLRNPEMLKLGGEERIMTVIFSDVAGFTSISEHLTPGQLVELLNEYLTAMTDIVLSYDGIIDKYEGDAVMAEFGAPMPDDDHALKACFAALDMQRKLAEMRAKWKTEGKPELRARVGINSGAMIIGNMGSREIFDYTVMGDNVNLSSRLEGANKIYGTYIMCSEATRLLAGDSIITRELDVIRVKGKTEGVKIHEVIARASDGLGESRRTLAGLYSRGLDAYKNRRWEEGIGLFRQALEIDPSDGPSALYLERCGEFLGNPPGDEWDGIFIMRTK
jgi:adenylate cyclase